MKRLNYLLLLVAIVGPQGSFGQTISSTYSDNGLGIFNYQGLPHNMGMGEVGYATPSTWSMNLQNPSFLPLNGFSMFQVGIEMDRRSMQSDEFSARKVSGGLRYLNYAFPIVRGKWTSSFGLAPYSNSSLEKYSRETLTNGNVEITQLINSGGLSSLHFSNGFKVSDALYLGVKTSFMFGSLDYIERKSIEDQNSISSQFTDETAYSGIKLDLSAGYRIALADKKWMNFGVVFEPAQNLSGERLIEFQSELSNTTTTINDEITYKLPTAIGIGIGYQMTSLLTVGADFKFSQWSNAGFENDDLSNTLKAGIGGEWTPDYSSVNNYWNRVTYRLGINFDKLPYRVNGQDVNEVGVNFGASFPIGLSSLDTSFKYGRLGSLDNGLIRENYFRIVIGATINDRWFIKRRYD